MPPSQTLLTMANYCQYALKQWSVTVDSLLGGRQILLLRKGGIHEQREGFHIEPNEFFLLPTVLHQILQALQPRAQLGFLRGRKLSAL